MLDQDFVILCESKILNSNRSEMRRIGIIIQVRLRRGLHGRFLNQHNANANEIEEQTTADKSGWIHRTVLFL